jgi:hypothetical protein
LHEGNGEGALVVKELLLQQLLVPEPSQSRSTPGKGKPGICGGLDPLFLSVFPVILSPSGLGSMSAKMSSGGTSAITDKTSVLKTTMPVKSLPFTVLFSITV